MNTVTVSENKHEISVLRNNPAEEANQLTTGTGTKELEQLYLIHRTSTLGGKSESFSGSVTLKTRL